MAEEHEDDALLLYPEDAVEQIDDGDEEDEDSASVDSGMTVEPECDRANSMSFYTLCKKMETLWNQRKNRKRKKVTEEQKKKYLLPSELLKKLEPQSIFPLMRLLVPDQDNARNCKMKESKIAQAYCGALGFNKGTSNYEMLYGFTDPQKVPHQLAGDLSLVVQHVMMQRLPKDQSSRCTLGQINQYLDELAEIGQAQRGTQNHGWRDAASSSNNKKKAKKQTQTELRARWLRKINNKACLSPLEHKWLVRILLQKMEFGLSWRTLFTWYNEYALELWNAHNSLKNLCDKLADPEYTNQRRAEEEAAEERISKDGSSLRWEPQAQPAVLGNTILPMLSNRTRFEDCIEKIEGNHSQYLQSAAQKHDGPPRLSLKFPTICAEIKVDGERMVIHVTREGIVTMHTRNAKWYSQIYSPGLAPSIRKAVHGGRYQNVDVILDGEICSWDDGRKELIPFGNNRTVANERKGYLSRHHLLDARDLNLHSDNPADSSIMRSTDEFKFVRQSAARAVRGTGDEEVDEDQVVDPGKECWLQFLVFDILYVGGPDAKRLFDDCGFDTNDGARYPKKGGSIIHLPLLQRKQVLYQLIEEQPTEVEFCQAIIVRPNGDVVDSRDYFRIESPLMEYGCKMTLLDSTQATISEDIPDLDDVERRRQQSRSINEIGPTRAQAIDDFYRKVVEENRFEGLVFKDVAAPYVLGELGRKRNFWFKFKPDYDKNEAVDIDVVIVGAYFATGLRHSGKLSHFLCACVDSDDPSKFLTVCNVNGASVQYDKLFKILDATGFARASDNNGGETQLGKWFQQDDGEDPVPGFISSRSLQRGYEDYDGWKFNRSKNYPDLWIHPDDSVVLTIYGQELVQSEEYSAGISLRFARISKIRLDSVDGDEKRASEIDNEKDLWHRHLETFSLRQGGHSSELSQDPSADTTIGAKTRRFLTPEEHNRRKTRKRKGKTLLSPSKQVPKVESKESDALAGLFFTVLEGNYGFDDKSLEAQEGQEEGWFGEASKVRKKEDVMEYILKHGGAIRVSAEEGDESLFILGGMASDAKVSLFMKGIEYVRSQVVGNPKTKKAIRQKALASHDGVLKWTFAYTLVHRHMLNSEEQRQWKNIKIIPKAHHYLARTKATEAVTSDILALDNAADATKAELMMALLDIERRRENEGHACIVPWQSRALELANSDYSILSCCSDNPFWSCPSLSDVSLGETTKGCVLLYPDIFRNGPGAEEYTVDDLAAGEAASKPWEDILDDAQHCILSVLPIARAMGAIITTHLTSTVTHIVCELKAGGQEDALDLASATSNHFCDPERGGKLLDRLRSMQFGKDVSLVHPNWVRSIWFRGRKETRLA